MDQDNADLTNNPSDQIPTKIRLKIPRYVQITLILLFICLGVVGIEGLIIYYRTNLTKKTTQNVLPPQQPIRNQPYVPPAEVKPKVELTRFGPESYLESDYFGIKGELKQIASISGLVKDTGSVDKNSPIQFFDAGVYQTGFLAGYKRILVAVPMEGMGVYYYPFIFATLDNKEYVYLDDSSKPLTKVRLDEIAGENQYSFSAIDFSNIKKVAVLPPTVPARLTLNSAFKLTRESTVVQTKNVQNGDIYSSYPVVIPNLNDYKSLVSPSQDYKLYSQKYVANISDSKKETILEKYVVSNTNVYSVDSSGLMYSHRMAWVGTQSNLDFPGTDLQTGRQKFNTYSNVYFTGGKCGGTAFDAIINDVIAPDLEKIGSIYWQDAYAIKDKSNQLLWMTWLAKFENPNMLYDVKDDQKKEMTLEEYQAKTPLVFFKDNWGRWIAVGENDYKLVGGCAKPVLYFYPQKPTAVTAKFVGDVQFDVTIPNYTNSWQVLAQPDGMLTDLQSEKTDCNKLNFGFGSEYAQNACLKNQYPYLYWAGQSFNSPYPEIKSAWYVLRSDVPAFFENKLSELGLNTKEIADFKEYWVPKLLAHPEPYFQLSFLNTNQMNKIAPMQISPAPQTVYRLFLDFKPLVEVPKNRLPEPTFAPLIRKGFTVVEWGGLKE